MTLPRPLVLVGRACFSLFVLLTSIYCLLTYIPFTYQQVHVAGLLPWLTTFVKIHSYIYWLALAILVPTILPDLRHRNTKILTFAFLAFCAGTGIVLLWSPLLSGLQNDVRSLEWALGSLLPLVWLAVIDWVGRSSELRWTASATGEDARVFRAAWQSALFSALVYSAIFFLRHREPAQTQFGPGEGLTSLLWTIFSHLLLFMVIFVALFLVRAIGGFFHRPKLEFLLYVTVGGLLFADIVRVLVLRQISFEGFEAAAFSVVLGLCLAASFAGLGLRLYPTDTAVESGLALLLTPLRWTGFLSGPARLVPLGILAVLAYFLEVRAALLDWNYLLQKLSVLFIWTAAFANLYDLALRKKQREEVSAVRAAASR